MFKSISSALGMLVVTLGLLVAGCAHQSEPEVRWKERTVPVHVPCDPENLPPKPRSYAADGIDLTGIPDNTKEFIFPLSATILQDRAEKTQRLIVVEAALAGCMNGADTSGVAPAVDK